MGRHRMRWEGVLGTFLEVQVETPFPFLASRVFRAVLAEVERLEGVFSRYRESELTRLLERGQGTLSPELAHLLALGLRLMEATGGAFTLSPGFLGVPLELKGERALVHAPLDLDGFAKGYIADRALERAWGPGVAALLVNLGGDLAYRGRRPLRVGVEGPHDNAPPLFTLRLPQGGLAVSGTRFKGEHLRSWRGPVRTPLAGVVAPSAALADALTKAVAVLEEEAWPVLSAFGAEGFFLRDGVHKSPGLARFWEGEDA